MTVVKRQPMPDAGATDVKALEPLLIELGVLLDVFVGVFVMGIIIFHINRTFEHLDTSGLSQLRD